MRFDQWRLGLISNHAGIGKEVPFTQDEALRLRRRHFVSRLFFLALQ